MTDGELPWLHEAEISSKDSQKGIITNKVYTYLPNPEWFSKPSFSERSVLFRAPPILCAAFLTYTPCWQFFIEQQAGLISCKAGYLLWLSDLRDENPLMSSALSRVS